MDLQKLLSYIRKAVDTYQLIEDNDKIAVGVSGGKDSLTLLYALHALQRFYPHPFELMAVSVDLGFENFQLDPVHSLCEKLGVPFHVEKTQIAQVVFQERQEKNPCSLCAKMRKGALNQTVKKLGFQKIAYAHHKDDIVETALLSLFFEGQFYSFAPKTYLDGIDLTVIRPLIYVPEMDIRGFQKKYQLPVVKNPCPADGATKRESMKNLLRQLNRDHPGVKQRIFHAIETGNITDWVQCRPERRKQ